MAKKQLDQDHIQLEVVIGHGSENRKDLAETKQALRSLKTEAESLRNEERKLMDQRRAAAKAGNTEEVARLKGALQTLRTQYGQVSKSIEENVAKQQKLRNELGITGQSLNDLRQTAIGLKSAINAAVPETPELAALQEKLSAVQARIKEVGTEAGQQAANWEKQRQGMALTEMNAHQLGLEMKRLQAIINDPKASLADNQQAIAQLAAVKDRTEELTNANRIAATEWEKQRQGMALTEMNAHQLGLEMARLQAIINDPKSAPADVQQAAKDMAAAKDRTEQLTNATRIAREEWVAMRGSFTLDQMTGDQLKLEIAHLEELVAGMHAADPALAATGKRLDEAREHLRGLTTEAGRAEKEWMKLRESLTLDQMNSGQLKREQDYLESLVATMTEADVVASGTGKRLDEVKDRIRRMGTEAGRAEAEWERLRQGMKLEDMSIEQLKLEAAYLKKLKDQLPTTSAEFDRLEKELKQVEGALDQATNETTRAAAQWEVMRKNVALTDMTMEQLEAESRRLKAALQGIHPDDAAFARTRGELDAVDKRMERLRSGLGPFGRMWADVKTQVMGAGAVLGTLFAGGALIQGFRSLITGGAKLSDELVNIQRVTGKTANEVGKLNSEIGKIDTRTANTELRGIAVGLGQVGQEVSAAAVTAIDKINLALGDEFGTDAKEITTTISVLRNNLSDLKSGNYADDVGKIGNAILVLGQSGLATAPVVSDIATRVAGVARQFKISSGDILGTAASFQELGISTERGSTAYTKLLQKISTAPLAFAEVVKKAGGNVEEFLKLVDTDMQAAFLMVAKAARTAGTENTAFGEILKELETSGAGVSELLSKVGANTELFAAKSKLATEALKNQNAINAQAKLANENLAAQLEKLSKLFNRVFTSRTVINAITALVGGFKNMLDWVQRNSNALVFATKVVAAIAAGFATFRLAVIASTLAAKAELAMTKGLTAAQVAYSTVVGVLTGKIKLATVASAAFNTVTKLNPIAFVIGLLTTAVGLYSTLRTELEGVSDAIKEMNGQQAGMNILFEAIKHTNEGTKTRADLIRQLNEQYGEYLPNLLSEKSTLDQVKTAQIAANGAFRERIELQARQERIDKAMAEGVELQQSLLDLERERAEVVAKGVDGFKAKWYQIQELPAEMLFKKALEGFDSKIKEVTESIRIAQGEYERLLTGGGPTKRDPDLGYVRPQPRKPSFEGLGAHPMPPAMNLTAKVDVTEFNEATATVGQLDAKIKQLKKSLLDTADPAAAAGIRNLIAHYQELRAGILGTTTASAKSKEELTKHLDELAAQMDKWREGIHDQTLSDDERELAELDRKHREELAKVKEQQAELIEAKRLTPEQANTDLLDAERAQEQARIDLIEAQGEKRFKAATEANDRIEKALGDGRNAHLQAEADAIQEELAQMELGSAEYYSAVSRHKDALLRLYEDNAISAVEEETKKWDKVIEEAKKRLEEYDAALIDNSADPSPDQLAERKNLADGILQLEQRKNDAIEDINRSRRQRERKAEREATQAERTEQARRIQNVAEWGGAVSNILDSIVQYQDAGIQAAEARADQDGVRTEEEIANIQRLKKARREMALASIKVQIATAIATGVASAIASPIPFPGNLLAAAGSIATIIGLFAQAKSLMSESDTAAVSDAQPAGPALNNVPLGEKGIRELPGPSHGQGGLDVVDTRTGQPVANIEGGEAVINKEVARKNPEVIDSLLAAAHRSDKTVQGPVPMLTDGGHFVHGTALVNAASGGDGPSRFVHGTAIVNALAPGTDGALPPMPNGIFGGSSHDDGGNSVYDNATGRQIAEVQEGEAWMVLSKRFTDLNRDNIGTIMEASKKGLRLDFSAPPLPKPSPTAVSRAMNVVHMAQGGLMGMEIPVKKQRNPGAFGQEEGAMGAVDATPADSATNAEMLALLREMLAVQKGTLEGVKNYPEKIEAFMVPSKANDRVVSDWEARKAKRVSKRA